ncbi:MAG TPA: LysR family transcriptional regulator [Polyangiaceae bacterium]|nr:LysR family transcriptional regulator [Polyangiaceae bacterium]
MLNFNHLYYFHVTAVEGSVKAAADRLGVTQPTVSEQIRMLERSLGFQLFERTTGGLRLTERGRQVFEHTTAMFLAGERLVDALGQHNSEPISLRVGVSASVSRTVAADFLMPVLSMEQCRPHIRTGDFNDLLRDLRAHEIDLLVGDTEPIEAARPDIELSVLHRPVLVAIVHPEAEPNDNWQNLSLLEYRTASAYHWEVDNFLRDRGLQPTSMGELDDAFLMLEAVARGGFVAFVPSSVARAGIRRGRVKGIAHFTPSSAGVHALFHKSDKSSLARSVVEKLILHAREHFDD